MRKWVNWGLALAMLGGVIGCSSVNQTAEYPPSARARSELARLRMDLEKANAHQTSMLAPREMAKAQSYFVTAEREYLRPNRLPATWEAIGYSRAYLTRAKARARSLRSAVGDVLVARYGALSAGASRYPGSARRMDVIDGQFAGSAPSLVNDESLRRLFIRQYRDLEVMAVQEHRLGATRSLIAAARRDGAGSFAPDTLKAATVALRMAESAIAQDPRRLSAYRESVARARRFAHGLTVVNAIARGNAARTDEQVALRMLRKDMDLADLRTQLKGSELEAKLKGRALAAKEEELRRSTMVDKTLADVRRKFARDEADVYRDGDKLLIQLKKMDFKSGSADLPAGSRPLLSKVKAVLRDVNARDVVVQGHADSTGSPRANHSVSEARAEAVADYIEDQAGVHDVSAIGWGEDRPIRSNKTADGRAANRRVDLLITPAQQ